MEDARREFRLGGAFQTMSLRYVQAQLVQAMQSAGCNAKHNFEQRLARWLLICGDRANTDTFKISHEFLADMLGGRRPTISTSAGITQTKRTYRIHSRRNSHPRRSGAQENRLRVLSDHQRLSRKLHKVRHRIHCVAASPAAVADESRNFGKVESGLVSTTAFSFALVRGLMPPATFSVAFCTVRLVS